MGSPARAFGDRLAKAFGTRSYDALVIGTPSGMSQSELWRQGMAGMGAAAPGNAIDTLTGGQLSKIANSLRSAETGLKLAVGASVFAGAAALLMLITNRRRARP